MSDISTAIQGFQTALVAKFTQVQNNEFFTQEPADSTTIRTTKNIKVVGAGVVASNDVLGNQNLS